jgi:tRNA pseudouridine38-40 synthase
MAEGPIRHVRLVVEYDGTTLCGYQRQLTGPTVQQHLEEALSDLLAHPVTLLAASRTDAGVHARGQVCLFHTTRTIPTFGIMLAVNARLPPCVSIAAATEVDAAFHPRFSARGKHYRYSIFTRISRSALHRDRTWHMHRPLDLARVAAAAQALIGEHDFAAFRAVGCAAKTTVRRIDAIDVTRSGDVVTIDVRGNAFLRNMVRIVTGTLVEVGTGKREVAQVAEILAGRDRTRAGITAPAAGLCLEEVFYA